MATATAKKSEHPPEQSALIALDAELERRRSVIEASAASLIDPQRLKAVVLSQFTRNPELWECDTVSLARAVVEAATYGLEPTGAIGGAHLVPFYNSKTGRKEVQLIIDYRGYVRLARRSGEVSKVWARTVREKDEFYVDAGTADTIHHRPYMGSEDPGNVTHVYAVIAFRDGGQQFNWDTTAWVESIRRRAKAKDKGPWVTDWAEWPRRASCGGCSRWRRSPSRRAKRLRWRSRPRPKLPSIAPAGHHRMCNASTSGSASRRSPNRRRRTPTSSRPRRAGTPWLMPSCPCPSRPPSTSLRLSCRREWTC